MKFYYNNKLVRASNTAMLRYAVVDPESKDLPCISCHETYDDALKALTKIKKKLRVKEKQDILFITNPKNAGFLLRFYGRTIREQEVHDDYASRINRLIIAELIAKK